MYENRMNNGEHKRCWLKYFGVIGATLLGAFLAFYVVTDCTYKHLMCPAYGMDNFEKIDRMVINDFKKMDKDFDRASKQGMFFHRSAVDFVKTPDSYKFVIDLTPFQGNPEAINVSVEDRVLTISGESSISKNNYETFTKMSQSYTLCPKANIEKLSKKKVDNKYIITVPIED